MGTDPLRQALAAAIGRRIPGGCQDCDAYQTIDTSQAPLVYMLRVHHDDTCPTFRAVTS